MTTSTIDTLGTVLWECPCRPPSLTGSSHGVSFWTMLCYEDLLHVSLSNYYPNKAYMCAFHLVVTTLLVTLYHLYFIHSHMCYFAALGFTKTRHMLDYWAISPENIRPSPLTYHPPTQLGGTLFSLHLFSFCSGACRAAHDHSAVAQTPLCRRSCWLFSAGHSSLK